MPVSKLVKFALIGGGVLVLLSLMLLVLWGVVVNLTATSTGLQKESLHSLAPETGMGQASRSALDASSSFLPNPQPSEYVPNLEAFETTDYTAHARTRDFAAACAVVRELKADQRYHFRSLNEHRNRCSATFFVAEADAATARAALAQIDSMELSRTTRSVTRLRAQVAGTIELLEARLASVRDTLTTAERDYTELRTLAREQQDVASLTTAIRDKVEVIEMLREREARLVEQLTRLYRNAQDLEERIGMVQFTVSIERLFPITNEDKYRFAHAWDRFGEQLSFMGIVLTAYLGIFLIWVVQATIYLAIVLIFARLLWLAGRFLWRR